MHPIPAPVLALPDGAVVVASKSSHPRLSGRRSRNSTPWVILDSTAVPGSIRETTCSSQKRPGRSLSLVIVVQINLEPLQHLIDRRCIRPLRIQCERNPNQPNKTDRRGQSSENHREQSYWQDSQTSAPLRVHSPPHAFTWLCETSACFEISWLHRLISRLRLRQAIPRRVRPLSLVGQVSE